MKLRSETAELRVHGWMADRVESAEYQREVVRPSQSLQQLKQSAQRQQLQKAVQQQQQLVNTEVMRFLIMVSRERGGHRITRENLIRMNQREHRVFDLKKKVETTTRVHD